MTNQQIMLFLLGGKATFTLESKKTGKHYTFKAVTSDNKKLIWISILTNGDEYIYLGTVFTTSPNWIYKITAKSNPENKLHSILDWFFKLLNSNHLHPNLIFRHAGRCSRCSRKLTTPESLDAGMGPICLTKQQQELKHVA